MPLQPVPVFLEGSPETDPRRSAGLLVGSSPPKLEAANQVEAVAEILTINDNSARQQSYLLNLNHNHHLAMLGDCPEDLSNN